jgi:hypothetical protein
MGNLKDSQPRNACNIANHKEAYSSSRIPRKDTRLLTKRCKPLSLALVFASSLSNTVLSTRLLLRQLSAFLGPRASLPVGVSIWQPFCADSYPWSERSLFQDTISLSYILTHPQAISPTLSQQAFRMLYILHHVEVTFDVQ